jgi:multiple sugar transport system permease protein
MTSATMTSPPVRTAGTRGPGPRPGRVLLYLALSVGAVLMIVPFLWMVLTAFKSDLEIAKFSWLPGQLRWHNFVEAMQTAPFLRYFRNSLFIAAGETTFTLAVCTTAGYALAKLPIRGSKALLSYFILLLLVPFQIILVPLFLIVKSIPLFGGNNIVGQGGIGWLNSWWGLIIPLGAAPLFTFLARQFYVSIPNELAQAARVDGLGEFGIFLRIMTPLVKPALITIGVFQIEAAWNGFLWPLMITTSDSMRPLQLGLAIFAQNPAEIQWPYLMAGTALATLPMIVMFIFAQKRFVEGMANVGIKG